MTVTHRPTRIPQQRCNLAIPVAAIFPCQRDHIGHQKVFVILASGDRSLCRPMLANDATGATFRYVELAPHMLDARPATGGA